MLAIHKSEKVIHDASAADIKDPVRSHKKSEAKQKENICATCEFKCADETNLTEHIKVHEELAGFTCTHCNFTASSTSDLNNHIGKNHLNGLNCPECEFTCDVQNEMKLHREAVHNLNCHLCGFTAINAIVLKEHTKIHMANYLCDSCDYSCPVKDDMTEHVNLSHGAKKRKKIFPCTECDNVFEENYKLDEHVSCHQQEKTINSERNILHNFLTVIAKQQDIPEIRSQQEALRVEVSDALKAFAEHVTSNINEDPTTATPAPNITQPSKRNLSQSFQPLQEFHNLLQLSLHTVHPGHPVRYIAMNQHLSGDYDVICEL